MDILYYNEYIVSIYYNTLVLFYVLRMHYLNQSVYYGHNMMISFMTLYEVYTIYTECKYSNNSNDTRTKFIANMFHHISASLIGLLILINPEVSQARQYMQFGFMYMPTSTFILNLSLLFPKQIIWKILFSSYFIWIRLIKQTDAIIFAIKYVLGYVVPDTITIFPNVLAYFMLMFTSLNIYWGTLIILKAKRILMNK